MKRKTPFYLSIRFQLATFITLLVIGISSASFWLMQQQVENSLKHNLAHHGQAISTLIAEDMAKLTYLNDPDISSSISARIEQIAEVHSASFYDTSNQLVLAIGANKTAPPINHLTTTTPLYYQGVHLGSVRYTLFSQALNDQIQKTNTYFIYMLSALLFISVLGLYFIDRRFIVRLADINHFIRQTIESRDFTRQMRIDSHDEVGMTRRDLNQLMNIVNENHRALKKRANHDSLTQLYSRECLLESISASAKQVSPGNTLCYIGLDQFKVVNDVCGHVGGDLLLQQLSLMLKKHLANDEYTTLFRISGDEFAILITHSTELKSLAIISHFHTAIRQFKFQYQERTFHVGASIGVIQYEQQAVSAQDLLAAAGFACAQAKEKGRDQTNSFHISDSSLQDERKELSWISRIYSALEKNEFQLFLQPIVPTANTGESYQHFETLLRLNKDGEFISPAFFIPIAERYGFSKKIDLWVIQQLFTTLQANPIFTQSLDAITINLSMDTLMDPASTIRINRLIQQFDAPLSRLCFEITETGMIKNYERAQSFISHFKNLGIRFALDDFGAGMSSFGYLSKLPVEYLKIDGQFVEDMKTNPVMYEMVKSMNNIGHITHKKVIAEYVEDWDTVALLKEVGVDYIQGYIYSQPKPIEHFIALAAKDKAI